MSEIGKIEKPEFSFDSFYELMKEVVYISRYWAYFDEKQLPSANAEMQLAERIARYVWQKEGVVPIYDRNNITLQIGDFSKEKIKQGLQLLAQGDDKESYISIMNGDFDFFDADCFFQMAVLGKLVYPKQ
jgi:hypothetical protein